MADRSEFLELGELPSVVNDAEREVTLQSLAEKGSVSKRGGTSSSSSVLISLGFQSQMTAPVELSQCWIKTRFSARS